MKKLVLIIFAVLFTASAFGQQTELLNPRERRAVEGPFRGFFQPIPSDLTSSKVAGTRIEPVDVWLFRPMAQVTALQVTYNKELKSLEASSLQQAGVGLSYQHFIDISGQPYNNISLNALMLFDMKPTEVSPFGIAGAVTVTALQFVNAGFGYNFTQKKPFILTGVAISFN